jgi:drug/metabolite transporter (DMT)-like permease
MTAKTLALYSRRAHHSDMRLFLLTALTMTAFAANSVLNRMAVGHYGMPPESFAIVRALSGAVVLWALVALRGGRLPLSDWKGRLIGAGALSLYLVGFSLAYGRLDAGIGALILFGGVQMTMFGGAVIGGEAIPARRWIGAVVSLAGLAYLVWPRGAADYPAMEIGFMAAAAFGWGIYSLKGRGAKDPLALTAANFVVSVPIVGLLLFVAPFEIPAAGTALAILSGAVTSGLGYALWYAVLPSLGATRAAVAQLSAPVIAALGGAVILVEPVGAKLIIASVLVLGGIALSLMPKR